MSGGSVGLGDRVLFPPLMFAVEVAGGVTFAALAIQNGVAGSGDQVPVYAPIAAAGIVGAAIQVLLPIAWSQTSSSVRVVETLTVPGSPVALGPRVTSALSRICGASPQVTSEPAGRTTYRSRSERSWLSWGEWVEVDLTESDGETLVSIASTPRGNQFLTFGACSRKVDQVRSFLLNAAA